MDSVGVLASKKWIEARSLRTFGDMLRNLEYVAESGGSHCRILSREVTDLFGNNHFDGNVKD
jgi:hypothetical protein